MKVASDHIGHSTAAVTAKLYFHVTSELGKESAERMAAANAGSAMSLCPRRPSSP
jgi:hypothetical protein